jgi:hypothetical protein
MATYIKTDDAPGLRQAYLGSAYPKMPTGKKIDELWAELGFTVPTQTTAQSTFLGTNIGPGGTEFFIWNIGNGAPNEYLVCVPKGAIKNLTIKTEAV